MEFGDVIAKRYSCKKYDVDRQVAPETLTRILEAGRLAPTAKNLQAQHVYVLQSAESLEVIDALTPCRYGAPTVLVVAFDATNVYSYPGGNRDSGIEDAAIVATHMVLAARDADVDSCWVNNFDLRRRGRRAAPQPREPQAALRHGDVSVGGQREEPGATRPSRPTTPWRRRGRARAWPS